MDAPTRLPDAACVADDRTPRVRDRADACPGALDAASADDGLIARIRLPGGRVTGEQLRVLGAAAGELGGGFVDLTVRANLQIRGLSPAAVPELAERLADAGLLPSPAHDRVRNISASPFAGRDPHALVDGERLVVALDAALCADPELAALPGRFQFAVDDGGPVRVTTRRHDVALIAHSADTVALHVAGTDTGLRSHPGTAAHLATGTARAFLHARAGSGAWHVAELPQGVEQFVATLTGADGIGQPAPPPSRSPVVGTVRQCDGHFALAALAPLGRLTSHQLDALGTRFPARIRLTPWRGIVVADVDKSDVHEAEALLDTLGLPTDPASPWRGISACSGKNECHRALTDIRAVAREFAGNRTTGGDIHFAACPRACGRPPGAASVVAVTPTDFDIQPPTLAAEITAMTSERPAPWTTG